MKRIALLLLFSAGMLSAQVTKNLGDFDQLKVFDQIQVTLVQSDQNKIELRGQHSGDVEFVTKNNQLKIRMPINRTLDGEGVKATLYYKSLNDVDASEGALITTSETIKTRKMTVTAKEGAQIELNLDVDNVDVKSVTGANITLAGSANSIDIKVGTGGIVDAKSLTARDADVNVNAGGEVDITATDEVDADVKAGGNIRIYGNPREVNKKTTLGGSIEVKK